jgi:hypothetical protein
VKSAALQAALIVGAAVLMVDEGRRDFDVPLRLSGDRLIFPALSKGAGGGTIPGCRLSQVMGMSRTTITKAIEELRGRGALIPAAMGRIRREGGGRKPVEEPQHAERDARFRSSTVW